MNKEKVRDIIYLIIAILLSVVAVRLFIWLLPVILVLILTYYIYKSLKINKKFNSSNNKTTNNNKKKIVIIDSEDNN